MNYLTTGKVLVYLGVIFLAGGTTGAVITLRNTRERQVQVPSVEKACHRFQDRLVSRLRLSPEQVAKLQPVFDETVQQLRTIHTRAQTDTDEVLRRAHERIAAELSSEQKRELVALDQEREDWLKRRSKERSRGKE